MAWDYTASPYPTPWPTFNLPVTANQANVQLMVDTVRFLIGDTDSTDQQFQNGEIIGLFNQNNGNPYAAAVEGCRALAAKYTRQVDKTVGDLRINSAQRAKNFLALIPSIAAQGNRFATPTPYAGGIRDSDKEIDEDDDDIVTPAFAKGMMDDPGTAPAFGQFTDGGFTRSEPGG